MYVIRSLLTTRSRAMCCQAPCGRRQMMMQRGRIRHGQHRVRPGTGSCSRAAAGDQWLARVVLHANSNGCGAGFGSGGTILRRPPRLLGGPLEHDVVASGDIDGVIDDGEATQPRSTNKSQPIKACHDNMRPQAQSDCIPQHQYCAVQAMVQKPWYTTNAALWGLSNACVRSEWYTVPTPPLNDGIIT